MDVQSLTKRVRFLLWFFVLALVLSGITAFPLKWEIDILRRAVGPETFMASLWPAMANWIAFIHRGLIETYQEYPFIAYGTDWLAFAHIVIAIAFLGPLKDPTRNLWVIEFGMIACVLIIPLALIWGSIRGIPLFWRLIDCSFGVLGIIPLWIARHYIQRIIEIESVRVPTQ